MRVVASHPSIIQFYGITKFKGKIIVIWLMYDTFIFF